MDKNAYAKDRIIEAATELIEQHNGSLKDITARMIAVRAGVGLGLINYHFGSKEKLITECVQRIIGKIVAQFQMTKRYETDKERLTACAASVFHFLFEHSAISRISIWGDFQNYTENCNSVLTQRGFLQSFKGGNSGKDQSMLVFILTAAMQAAFLGGETIRSLLGYDFTKAEDRDAYIVNWSIFFLKGRRSPMNRKIGAYSSILNCTAVLFFALSMLSGSHYASYLSSMLIAFSFVPMMCAYAYFAEEKVKLAGYVSVAFSAIYAAVILLVYFAQLTTVRLSELTRQAAMLLDFQQCGLLFNYDLLGYAVMSLATCFAGLTVTPQTRADRWLKLLLMLHGVFFISCLIAPMLGLFKADSPAWIGVAVLEFWCLYFFPVGVLSYLHFSNCKECGSCQSGR